MWLPQKLVQAKQLGEGGVKQGGEGQGVTAMGRRIAGGHETVAFLVVLRVKQNVCLIMLNS
jgi:hypothetical protein